MRFKPPRPTKHKEQNINVQTLSVPHFIDLRTFDRLWLPGYDTADFLSGPIPSTLKIYRYQVTMTGCNHCRVQHSFKTQKCWRTQNPYQTDIPYRDGYADFFTQDECTPYLRVRNRNYKCIKTSKTNNKVKISTFVLVDNSGSRLFDEILD